MMRNWKWFCLPLLLTSALVASPRPALGGGEVQDKKDKLDVLQDQVKNLAETVNKKFEDLTKSLSKSFDDVQKDVGKLQKEIKQLKEDKIDQAAKVKLLEDNFKVLQDSLTNAHLELNSLKKKMDGLKANPAVDKDELWEFRAKLETLEKAVQQLKAKSPYVAGSSPSGTCKVVLINNTSEEITVFLNKTSYRVAAGSYLNVQAVPAGAMSYEVLYPGYGSIRKNVTTLDPSQVFSITVG